MNFLIKMLRAWLSLVSVTNDCCAPAHLEASKSARTAVASRTIGINLSCSP